MGEICKKTNIEHKKKNGKTLAVKPFLSGKSTARGYNAPCFVGMVHFLRLSINTRGTMGTERTKESIYAGFA